MAGAMCPRHPLDADFIALYTAGATRARRRIDGRIQEAAVGPGCLSFLPRGADCNWSWDQPISVIHVYVPRPVLARTYAAMSSDDPDKLVLHDALVVDDPAMFQVVSQMADECRGGGLGSGLCFETLSQLLAIQLLRKYCHNIGRVTTRGGRLSSRQRTQLTELIEAHLSQPVTLDFLATEIGVSESRLTRLFRTTFGQSIHQYVIERRLLKAKSMLADPERSIADIAYEAGFSDQSHLTRFFSRAYRTTPAAWRRAALS